MIKLNDTNGLLEQDQQHHFHPMTNPTLLSKQTGVMVDRADGIFIYTNDNRQIMDVGSGLGNVSLGYGNTRLCDAGYKAMQQLSFGHSLFGRSNPWIAALSDVLAQITPDTFQRFFFASTGSEAIESSIKIALHYWRLRGQPEKRAIISRRHSYHGNTIIATGLTGMDSFHSQFGLAFTDNIYHADSPYSYRYARGRSSQEFGLEVAASLERQIREIGAENIAAFVGDPIQTGGGTIIPPESYWPEIRRLCDHYDILLIADEVFSGFGKTGQWFGFQNFGFEPDLFCMGKGLTSGYFPLSSVAISEKVDDVLQGSDAVFSHVFTNCGHPVGAAVALETIAFIQEECLVEKIRDDIGPYFAKRLKEFQVFPCVGEVRSLGVLGAIEIDLTCMNQEATLADSEALMNKFIDIAWKKGLAIRGGGLTLPMIITREQIDQMIDILMESLTEAIQ